MKPLILIGNDDGIYTKGIRTLVEIAKEFGDVVVVAPDKQFSAKSHSVTLEKPIRYKKSSVFDDLGVEAYRTTGTPVDGIKLALNNILKRKPDLVLSGINHGANPGINAFYSGTVAVIIEAAMHKIPAIAFSYTSYEPNPDFTATKKYARFIIRKALESGQKDFCLNVNIPPLPLEEIKGLKLCKQTMGTWSEEFDEYVHPIRNEKYYWLTGQFINYEPDNPETDIWALNNGFVSVVPIHIDLTNYKHLQAFKSWEKDV